MSAFLEDLPPRSTAPLRFAIDAAYLQDEADAARDLLRELQLDAATVERVQARARRLATRLRAEATSHGGVEAFMHAYSLDTHEGVMLMCLAEALLRIPDALTQDRLIRDKLADVDWQKRVAASESFLVNASAFGLMLSGKIVSWDQPGADLATRVGRIVSRLGEPVLREAMRQAMRVLGRQFVLGQTIDQAIERARALQEQGFLYSYDMLGEGAKTMADARRYLDSYRQALERIAAQAPASELLRRPSLSIKLSALHPRYELAKWHRLQAELLPALVGLLERARALDIAVTIDAEESERLEPSLDLFEALAGEPRLAGWQGVGLAVQAYQKRAVHVIAWLTDLARRTSRRIPVRLVKGAYWDAEIKHGQQIGQDDFPVFTRKITTDVAYLACAQRLLQAGDLFYPQFATHNAHTIACVVELAGNHRGFEFQKLHGMGDSLYRDLAGTEQVGVPCRVYAPVGSHQELLPYLVRRLLENGANSSFVHRVVDPETTIEALIADPIAKLHETTPKRHPAIPLPVDVMAPHHRASKGIDLSRPSELSALKRAMEARASGDRQARPGARMDGAKLEHRLVRDPADTRRQVGEVWFADAATAERAVALAHRGFASWSRTAVQDRAARLDRAATLMEEAMPELIGLCVSEAGKTIPDSLADVREAVDFLRYYATEAVRLMAEPLELPGPTGERNQLALEPRGAFVAISPWNFPIAIFTGQIAAVLATGNTVVAKPAEQTSLCAAAVVRILLEAGVPEEALVLVPGWGHVVGAALVADPRIAGVVFTGGTDTARSILRAMAAVDGPIRPLVAETGGLNALLVDNSALPEQVVADTVESAFRSAGQRCSALRILCLQEEIAARVTEMLAGAMAELVIGDPGELSTDIGPVIDEAAKAGLTRYTEQVIPHGRLIGRCALDARHDHGSFFSPTAIAIDRVSRLEREAFGPILHIVSFKGEAIDRVVDAVNATGYGLTFGIHSRIDETIERVTRRARAGNIYVNRNIIGAVVGAQPFGGEGLSGTGFKAGGPNYLLRFVNERTLTVNTAAVGGNLALLGKLEA